MMAYGLKSSAMRANDWHDPRWQAQAHAWMREQLDAPVDGEIEETRVRPWSVTLRARTAAGVRWFTTWTRNSHGNCCCGPLSFA